MRIFTTLAIWCGSFMAIVGFLVFLRKGIVKPLVRGYRALFDLLTQIRDASGGVQRLAREVETLAGAVTKYAMTNRDTIEEHAAEIADIKERLKETVEVLTDLEAEVYRSKRRRKDDTIELPDKEE